MPDEWTSLKDGWDAYAAGRSWMNDGAPVDLRRYVAARNSFYAGVTVVLSLIAGGKRASLAQMTHEVEAYWAARQSERNKKPRRDDPAGSE